MSVKFICEQSYPYRKHPVVVVYEDGETMRGIRYAYAREIVAVDGASFYLTVKLRNSRTKHDVILRQVED